METQDYSSLSVKQLKELLSKVVLLRVLACLSISDASCFIASSPVYVLFRSFWC